MTANTFFELIRADTIAPTTTSWLWSGFLLAGKLNLLAGLPGTGKTTVAMDLAARLTCGGTWPDRSAACASNVLIWSSEDTIAETLNPRLIAAGANLERVHYPPERAVESNRRFDIASDLQQLKAEMIRIREVRLLIIDPLISAVRGNTNVSANVRKSLEDLADLAETTNCAVLGIMHFTKGSGKKNALERIAGAGAFGQFARLALVCVRDAASETGARSLVRVKSNLGPDGGGFTYRLEECLAGNQVGVKTCRVVWDEELVGPAQELIDCAETVGGMVDTTILSDVKQWLNDFLSDAGGKAEQSDVMGEAESAGFKLRTVQRARLALGITTRQSGFGSEKRSHWTLPGSTAPSLPTQTHGTVGCDGTDGDSGIDDTHGSHGDIDQAEMQAKPDQPPETANS